MGLRSCAHADSASGLTAEAIGLRNLLGVYFASCCQSPYLGSKIQLFAWTSHAKLTSARGLDEGRGEGIYDAV